MDLKYNVCVYDLDSDEKSRERRSGWTPYHCNTNSVGRLVGRMVKAAESELANSEDMLNNSLFHFRSSASYDEGTLVFDALCVSRDGVRSPLEVVWGKQADANRKKMLNRYLSLLLN